MASIAALGTMVGLAAPAGASPTVLTGNANSIAAGGSDTSYFVQYGISQEYNVDHTKNTDGDYVTQIAPVNNAPFPAGSYVPGDAVAGPMVWDSLSGSTTPPNGSSAGIAALDADTTGQIDYARSSRGPNAGETSTHQFWAYALGALDYVTFPGTHAPAKGITQAQLIKIYTCSPTTHAPLISNWKQVGGKSGTIVKYLPQTSSGTYSFFVSKLMNGNVPDTNCSASHLSIFHEEHDSRSVTGASKPNAIDVFDWSKWKAQNAGYEADLRNGATLGKLGTTTKNMVAPSGTTVNTGAKRFLGTRYIFAVVRLANHPASYTNQLNDVQKLIGVVPGRVGFICAGGTVSKVIALAGFVPLPSGKTGGVGLANSHCRLNPVAL